MGQMNSPAFKILAWFETHKRDLPWRRTYLPYHIWISEIMLQQTQMERAVEYFNRWLLRFPDIGSLAVAEEEEVLKLWEGLGYYSRARNILSTARILVEEHNGCLPPDHAALLKLPGIGRYTAGAIMSLAFNRQFPVVDANVERLFARLYDIDSPVKSKETHHFIWQKAKELLPEGRAREFNQGLMELGALVCRPERAECERCPLRDHCLARKNETIDSRPVKGPRQKHIPLTMVAAILICGRKVFIQKRPATGRWAGLWEFPGSEVQEKQTPEQAVMKTAREATGIDIDLRKIAVLQHSFTRYRVTLHCFAGTCKLPQLPGAEEHPEKRWVTGRELQSFAFGSGHRKLIALLGKDEGFGELLGYQAKSRAGSRRSGT